LALSMLKVGKMASALTVKNFQAQNISIQISPNK
jgi:hypothetical protein